MFCLYVGIQLCEGRKFPEILNTFYETGNQLNYNECLVLDYLNKKFKTKNFQSVIGCKREK